MEEKKFDFNSIIGFGLLFAIMIWWMYTNQPTPEEIAAEEKAKTEQVQKANEQKAATANFNNSSETTIQGTDSLSLAKAQAQLGAFAHSATLTDAETVLENDLLRLVISNKGGQINVIKF